MKKQVVEAIYSEGWMKQMFDSFERYLSDELVFIFKGKKTNPTLSDLKRLISYWRTVFPDLLYQVHHIVCEEDIVAVNMTITGTQTSKWEGIESNGNRFEVDEMMFYRFENNKIVEIWEVYDEKLMLEQLRS